MSTFVQQFDRWFIQPHPRLTNPEKILRSRLLSTILLVLVTTVLLILVIVIRHDPDDIDEPTVQGGFILMGISLLMYLINRLGFTSIPALGVILPFTAVFIYIPFYSGEHPVFLAFLMIPIILTAIFFSLRWTTLISAAILLLVIALLAFVDQTAEDTPYWNLRNMLFFLVIATTLVLTFMRHLGNMEGIRQRELRRINRDLQQKVAELERFTYIVSHELKTPVVTIKNYTGSVDRDIKEGNSGRARSDLVRISSAADNLQNSIHDLLELSRIGLVDHPSEAIDLNELVLESLQALEARISAGSIEVRVMPGLPSVFGDRRRLREVFDNLIDNAIKAVDGRSLPTIEIGIRNQSGEFYEFNVTDNGIGIDPHYHERIFNLFEKLDPTVEGTGIGLTLVKRIVEFQGGSVWVESEGPGRGSTFRFTLPASFQTRSSQQTTRTS